MFAFSVPSVLAIGPLIWGMQVWWLADNCWSRPVGLSTAVELMHPQDSGSSDWLLLPGLPVVAEAPPLPGQQG